MNLFLTRDEKKEVKKLKKIEKSSTRRMTEEELKKIERAETLSDIQRPLFISTIALILSILSFILRIML